MGTARFILANHLLTASVRNGGGGGLPVREETSPHVMENAFTADRQTPWQSAGTPTNPFEFWIGMSSSHATTGVALLGFRPITPGAVGSVVISSGASSAVPGTYTTRATLSFSADARDKGAAFSTVSAQYWKVSFANSGGWSLGRIVLGTVVDLGLASGPGADVSRHQNRSEAQLPIGSFVIETLGDPGATFSILVNVASETDFENFATIAAWAGTVVYIDPDGNVYECLVPGGQLAAQRGFYVSGGLSRYAMELRLVRLP